MSYPRRTPVHAVLESLAPEWGERFDMTVALGFAEPEQETRRLAELGLADLSALRRVGLKGPAAEAWLRNHGYPAPGAIYECQRLDGGLVIRVDTLEFLIEDGLGGGPAVDLAEALGPGADGAFRVERQDCSLLIAGDRALEVFAQTCGVNLAEMGDAFFKTRIALCSCSVKRDDLAAVPAWRLWLEPSYAEYLWTALLEIVTELGGGAVGWHAIERTAGFPPNWLKVEC
jgi:glycine cleavage system aminomethyltransferase T